jgi:hypothetical protein
LLRLGERGAISAIEALKSRRDLRIIIKYMTTAVALFVWFALSVASSRELFSRFADDRELAISGDYDLIKFYAESPYNSASDFIINCDSPLISLCAEYFSPFGRAYMSSYGGLITDWRRWMKDSIKEGDFFISLTKTERSISSTNAPLIASNEMFSIYRIEYDSMILSDFEGLDHNMSFYIDRGDHLAVRSMIEDVNIAKLEYMTVREINENFIFEFFDFNESDEFVVKVSLNEEMIGRFESEEHKAKIKFENLLLAPGKNVFKFEFNGDFPDTSMIALTSVKYK